MGRTSAPREASFRTRETQTRGQEEEEVDLSSAGNGSRWENPEENKATSPLDGKHFRRENKHHYGKAYCSGAEGREDFGEVMAFNVISKETKLIWLSYVVLLSCKLEYVNRSRGADCKEC